MTIPIRPPLEWPTRSQVLDAETVEQRDAPVRVLVHRPRRVRLRGGAEARQIRDDEQPARLETVEDRREEVGRHAPSVQQQQGTPAAAHVQLLRRGTSPAGRPVLTRSPLESAFSPAYR